MSEQTKTVQIKPDNPIDEDDSFSYYARVIDDLNQSFHHGYHQAIQRSHERLGKKRTPAIIVSGDHVTLFHDGKQHMELIVPQLYQQVKSISHLSFGIYVMLSNSGYGPLEEDAHANLTYQLDLIEQGLAILEKLDIPADFLDLQRETLLTAADIVREVLQTGTIDETSTLAFGKLSAPLYLDNAALAARLELETLHEVIRRWQQQIGPEDWPNTYVVICAAHQARYRETTKQYFQRLLHEANEGMGANYENRVIYAEHVHETDAALDLLARHLVDQKTSMALFGNRTRLQEDLMSDGAADYLDVLFRE